MKRGYLWSAFPVKQEVNLEVHVRLVYASIADMILGSDYQTLQSFFKDVFIPAGPASQHIRLLSRTVGTDKIVDEVRFSFCHTAEVPWLLPGVQPTDRDISVNIVVVACFRADRIVRQSLYWDQADVLVQAGVLDSKLVPKMEVLG